MTPTLKNNWPAKLASFIAAFAIWFLIKQHIGHSPPSRFAGYTAEDEKFRSQIGQLGADQLKVQELLEQAGQLQKNINETLLNNAPKAVPIEPAPPPTPPPTPPETEKNPSTPPFSSDPDHP